MLDTDGTGRRLLYLLPSSEMVDILNFPKTVPLDLPTSTGYHILWCSDIFVRGAVIEPV